MPLYEVTLRQSYFNQLCINTFGYFSPSGLGSTPNSLELLDLMGFIPAGSPLAFPVDTIASAIATIQNSSVQFLSAEARELYSVTDFYEAAYSPPLVGYNAGTDAMTPFIAYGLYTARIRLDIKRSTKRFVGVLEGEVQSGGTISAGLQVFIADLADKMSTTLNGALADYIPATISRERVVSGTPPKVKYQLYETETEQEEHIAYPLVWSIYDRVRSQTSRQYGHGN